MSASVAALVRGGRSDWVILEPAERPPSMKPKLKHEDTLEKAAAGITLIALAIIEIPANNRQKALGAVERSYHKIAMDLGFGERQAQRWAAVIMASLRAELQERLLTAAIAKISTAAYPLGRRGTRPIGVNAQMASPS